LPDFRVFSASHRQLSEEISEEAQKRAEKAGAAAVPNGRARAPGI